MGAKIITAGNEAYQSEAEFLVNAMRAKSHDDRVDLLVEALKGRFASGLHARRAAIIDESDIADALTSACARFIGLALHYEEPDAVFKRCEAAIHRVIDGLEEFALLTGSDTGAEGIQTVLRELAGYVAERDREAAIVALDRRLVAREARKPPGDDEVRVDGFVRKANESPSHATEVHRCRVLGLLGHCSECGAKTTEPCRLLR